MNTPIHDQLLNEMVVRELNSRSRHHVVAGGRLPEWLEDISAWNVLASRWDSCDDSFARQTLQSQGGLLNDTAQNERELTRSAMRKATPFVDEALMAQQDAQPHYAAARKVEAERARRAEEMAESARQNDQKTVETAKERAEYLARTTPTPFNAYFSNERLAYLEQFPGEASDSEQYRIMRAARRDGVLEESAEDTGDLWKIKTVDIGDAAREEARTKLAALNAELDRDAEAQKKYQLPTEAQFLGNEPMRVGYEDGAGHIIVGEAKITPGPDGGFMLTIDDGQATACDGTKCWCQKPKDDEVEIVEVTDEELDIVEVTDEELDIQVLEGEVIDGSKPWIIGQDIPTEVVEELTTLPPEFEQKGYVQGYQDGVTDTHGDERERGNGVDSGPVPGSLVGMSLEAIEELEKRSYAVDEEPAPVDQGNPSVHDLVVDDFNERKQHGLDVYGVTLQGGNGRDQLRDAYMEALDLTCYLRAALFERDGK